MQQMDSELFATKIGDSIPTNAEGDVTDEAIDMNLVKNFLSSYEGQGADAGPVSNFLNNLLKEGSLRDLEGV